MFSLTKYTFRFNFIQNAQLLFIFLLFVHLLSYNKRYHSHKTNERLFPM